MILYPDRPVLSKIAATPEHVTAFLAGTTDEIMYSLFENAITLMEQTYYRASEYPQGQFEQRTNGYLLWDLDRCILQLERSLITSRCHQTRVLTHRV